MKRRFEPDSRPDGEERVDNPARQYNGGGSSSSRQSPNLSRPYLPPSASPTASTSSWASAHFGPTVVTAAELGLSVPAETEISIVTDHDKQKELNRLFDEEIKPMRARTADTDAVERDAPINFRHDVGLDDRDLVAISTKDLNDRIKQRRIPRERAKEIKENRRTLKNRGYAANCRVKRLDEQASLAEDLVELDRVHEQRQREHATLRRIIEEQDRLLEIESSDEEDDDYDEDDEDDGDDAPGAGGSRRAWA